MSSLFYTVFAVLKSLRPSNNQNEKDTLAETAETEQRDNEQQ